VAGSVRISTVTMSLTVLDTTYMPGMTPDWKPLIDRDYINVI